jgi:pSer/pThr/pTyr-binding forkhead associated (FHA) protein
MPMSDSLLSLFRIGLLALLYLFFVRVLWAVWSEVRAAQNAPRPAVGNAAPPGPAPTPAPPAGGGKKRKQVSKLVVLEPRSRKGVVFPTDRELTVGRGPGCSIALIDDTFVSTVHARVYPTAEHLMLEDLGSTNGTYLNGRRLTAPQPVRKGDRVQIGSTVLEAD